VRPANIRSNFEIPRKRLIRAESDFVHFHAIVVSSPVPSRAMGNDN
jgi:hypothetical protein